MYLASQRKEFILKTLAEHGAARTIALAKQMKVTDETVRNDLINLEKRGFLKRVHGGALALTHKSLHEDIVTQDHVSIQIAKKTVQNIPTSVVMFIDSSTMGYQICNHVNSRDTHIVSNNPTLLTRLEGIPSLSFYCTGGRFDREAQVYVGQDAAHAAGSLNIELVVLTPDCYSPK
ncbi:DeoR family transcriptional regulator, partial [Akkermansia sp.]